ncbi:MAG: DUF871 domain-containing protein [Ruminococcaceae bacterium]|nr:DUF871 domain-containing protein [Oscillospiraceae bacterium]
MSKTLGFSLYLSTFETQRPALDLWAGTGAPIFLSLHISEEFDATYCQRAREICHLLAVFGFRTIADVSVKTLQQFGCESLTELAKELKLWGLRIDYGFTAREIEEMATQMPIVLNASTTSPADARRIAAKGQEVFALHNFYPRPETGLDEELLTQTTQRLREAGLSVQAFIPGDTLLRGPLHEGLPTLEAHRHALPSAAFVDMALRFGMDDIFLADPGLSDKEQQRIAHFCKTGVICVPAQLDEDWKHLYGKVFTCRIDSPRWLIRFQESRIYSCQGDVVEPHNCVERRRGVITVDNQNYGRYSGELMLIREELPADGRVNVIGAVPENAWLLIDRIDRGAKFMLVEV